MSLKQEVLTILERNKGDNISGEDLARQLDVSRAAIWRAIKELQSEGHEISAATRVGYTLSESSDILSAEGIRLYLNSISADSIRCYPSLSSTNRVAKQFALDGAPHGTVVLAGEQTDGRGRNGRSFFSPPGTGIYMSIVLRPDLSSANAILCTTATAVAVCRAIERVRGGQCGIKWVNDIYVDGHKVCGILTEGISGFESGHIESLVVGIGVNYCTPREAFPPDLAMIAGSLFEGEVPQGVSRNRLVAEIINEMMDISKQLSGRSFLQEYRARSVVIGKPVQVIQGNETYKAVAEEIDDNGALWVKNEQGETKVLNSGEITLRPAEGSTWANPTA